jgi:hypothetical protein
MDFSNLCSNRKEAVVGMCALWQICILPKEAIHHACDPPVGVRFLIDGTARIKQR